VRISVTVLMGDLWKMAGQPAKMVGLHNIIVRLFMVGRFSWCAKRRNVEKWENKSEKYHGDENILPSSSPPLLLDEKYERLKFERRNVEIVSCLWYGTVRRVLNNYRLHNRGPTQARLSS
jgi:hypothetical protein